MNKKTKKFLFIILPIVRFGLYLSLYLSFCFLNINKNSNHSICLFYEIFEIICPGCGTTRSFITLLNGDFLTAFEYNQIFVIVIFPIFTFLFLEDIITFIIRVVYKKPKLSLIEFLFKRLFI